MLKMLWLFSLQGVAFSVWTIRTCTIHGFSFKQHAAYCQIKYLCLVIYRSNFSLAVALLNITTCSSQGFQFLLTVVQIAVRCAAQS